MKVLKFYGMYAHRFDALQRGSRKRAERTFMQFFKADCIKIIHENCKKIGKTDECIKSTPIENLEIGKKYKFKAGDPFTSTGLVKGKVKFDGDKFLEIEIVPDKLYFYAWIYCGEVQCLEIIEKVE